MKLYYLPPSSYSQKVLCGLYEMGIVFEAEIPAFFDPAGRKAYVEKINPLGKVPCFELDNGKRLLESTFILEYVSDEISSNLKLVPNDKAAAREVRYWDRLFDLYVNDPMASLFHNLRRPEKERDVGAIEAANETLGNIFPFLDREIQRGGLKPSATLTLAECAAAPALFYCQFVRPFSKFQHLDRYAKTIIERPSYQRVIDEAKPVLRHLISATSHESLQALI